MALISRNTFSDTSNRKKVVEQLGVPVVDNESNEAQDIIMVEAVEGVRSAYTTLRNGDYSGAMRFGYVEGADWRPSAATSATVTIGAGVLHVEGYRLVLANNLDTTMAPASLTWGTVGGSDVYGYVYVDITMEEVDATTDSTMATPQVGETTVRNVLTAVWNKVEGTTSFAATFATITPLPSVSGARVWLGNTVRVFLFRYHRPAGNSNITQSMLLSLLKTVPSEARNRANFLKTYKVNQNDASAGTFADGMVAWDANTGFLQIGGADYSGSSTYVAAKCGMIVSSTDAPDHYLANSVSVIEPATPATGTADSPVNLPNWTSSPPGWAIADGSALGWSAGYSTTVPNNERILKGNGDQSSVYDVSTSAFAPDVLLIQQLTVQTLESFNADPSSFVLCTRSGNDLVWYNGWITRGGPKSASSNNGVNYPALETPGEAPSQYRAIVSAAGNVLQPGSNTLTGQDALERALNFSVAVPGSTGAYVAGSSSGQFRNIRIFCRGGGGTNNATTLGAFIFGRGIKRWGNTGEVGTAGGSSIVIEGDEHTYSNKPLLSFHNPLASSRSSSDTAVFQLNASKVSLRNLRLQQDAVSATYQAGYLLKITAESVELENCDFDSAVYIVADRVRIRNCRFNSYSHISNTGFVAATGSTTAAIPQCLGLVAAGTTDENGVTRPVAWDVQDNYFYPTLAPYTSHDFLGHAALVLMPGSSGGKVTIKENLFDGLTGVLTNNYQAQPSIHIPSPYGKIVIAENTFRGANGVPKTGNDQAVAAPPFNATTGSGAGAVGLYGGCPLDQFGYVPAYSISNTHVTADGYISVTGGRATKSSLNVYNNFFDFGSIAAVSEEYVLWGACMCVGNNTSFLQAVGGSTSVGWHNISFNDNTLNMSPDNGTGVGWANSGAPQPILWGFYSTLTMQDSAAITDCRWQNIEVKRNKFDLGGDGSLSLIWRSIFPSDPYGVHWPAGGTGYPTDGSALVAILLRNATIGSSTYSGRSAGPISICDNEISQRILSGGGYDNGSISLDLTATPRWWFNAILLSPNDAFGAVAPTLTGGQISGSGFICAPKINNNTIIVPAFGAPTVPPSPFTGLTAAAITCFIGFRSKICGNTIYMYSGGSGYYTAGIQTSIVNLSVADYPHISGNSIMAAYGIVGSAMDYASDNMLLGCQTPTQGSIVTTYTTNDNFA